MVKNTFMVPNPQLEVIRRLPSLHPSRSTFAEIRIKKGVYVDKTLYLDSLLDPESAGTADAGMNRFHLLTRPRRFGKTVLLSTLEAWFQGHLPRHLPNAKGMQNGDWEHQHWTIQELFAGLDTLRKRPHPVFRPAILLNMAKVRGETAPQLRRSLLALLSEVFTLWNQRGVDMGYPCPADHRGRIRIPFEESDQAPVLLSLLIHELYSHYGKRPVVLVDEYDAAITDMLGRKQNETGNLLNALRSFYRVLKDEEASLHYVMLTGIARFGHTNLFSALNNLEDITWAPPYAALCGFTQEEAALHCAPHLDHLQRDWPAGGDVLARMYSQYNGYRFGVTAETPWVCNPYTLTACLSDLLAYPALRPNNTQGWPQHWADSGTPQFLTDLVRRPGAWAPGTHSLGEFPPPPIYNLEKPIVDMLMLQTGYYTLRGKPGTLRLAYPNREVEQTYARSLLAAYSLTFPSRLQADLYQALMNSDIDCFVHHLTPYMYKMPYDLWVGNTVTP